MAGVWGDILTIVKRVLNPTTVGTIKKTADNIPIPKPPNLWRIPNGAEPIHYEELVRKHGAEYAWRIWHDRRGMLTNHPYFHGHGEYWGPPKQNYPPPFQFPIGWNIHPQLNRTRNSPPTVY